MPTVSDYTALLRYMEPDKGHQRWNAPEALGETGVVITYKFLTGSDVPSVSQFNSDNPSRTVTSVDAFTAAHQAAFRAAADHLESIADVKFVETTGDAMMEIVGMDPVSPTLGGFASYPEGYTYNPSNGYTPGGFNINTADFPSLASGAGYEILLHELGHAVGLKHSFDGVLTLSAALENTANTLMSYTEGAASPYSTYRPLDVDALEHIYSTSQNINNWGVAVLNSGTIRVRGTQQDDAIVGPVGESLLLGRRGDDLLVGRFYDDTIKGGGGSDTLKGLDGADRILGGGGSDKIWAFHNDGSFADLDDDGNFLNGGGGGDILRSGRGDDSLIGGGGGDRVYGGDGFDIIFGHTPGKLNGGTSKDRLYGGDGNDTINGGGGNDLIVGGEDHDVLYGNKGNDVLKGQDGFDDIYGGAGKDKMTGGDGSDDFIFGPDAGGVDLITDFEMPSGGVVHDRIKFEDAGVSYDDGVISGYGGGGNTKIVFSSIGLTIKVRGVAPDDFTTGYWDFEPLPF